MTERAHVFGSHGGLIGILNEPGAGSKHRGAPAIIFSNVGLNHRVGPNRLYVELARRLAASGFPSLRFDLSGFGDSEPRRSADSDLDRAKLDTREAMNFLERRGVQTFVLLGFCSGVDASYAVALQDPRVVGLILIDGYVYRNRGFWLRYFTVRNLQPSRWRRFFRLRWSRNLGYSGRRETGDVREIYVREYPSRERFSGDLARLVERDTKLLLVFTGAGDNFYSYRNQFRDTFGSGGQVEISILRADHVFSTEIHRESLLSRVVVWMEASFPPQAHVREESRHVSAKRELSNVIEGAGK